MSALQPQPSFTIDMDHVDHRGNKLRGEVGKRVMRKEGSGGRSGGDGRKGGR